MASVGHASMQRRHDPQRSGGSRTWSLRVSKTQQTSDLPDDIRKLEGLGAKAHISPRLVPDLGTSSGATTGTDLEAQYGSSLEDSFHQFLAGWMVGIAKKGPARKPN